ncbi:MAG: cytochrome C [Deltaproteobacteria bacterium]|nr:MAG: cytochrome C [Deltaproteobacteria bacterium]
MRPSPRPLIVLLAAVLLAACAPSPPPQPAPDVAHGRYLVQISGCNDCHTEDFMDRGGNVPEERWLTGSRRGWHNAQGTTYATNLRLLLNRIDEERWLTLARTMKTRAPMAWYRLREISDADLRAIYRYVRWLGPAGEEAPPALPAGVAPPEPYIHFPPVH